MTRKEKQPSATSAAAAAAKQLCSAIAEAMLDKKAQNVVSLDLSAIDGAIATYFVLCNADSTTQVEAIADNVEEHVRKALGEKPVRREGFENAIWIIFDYVDVMAHIFQTEARSFYSLDSLWADAKQQRYADEPQAAQISSAPAKTKATAKKATAKKAAAKKKSTAVKIKKSTTSK
jgi:ribosome-associated protein